MKKNNIKLISEEMNVSDEFCPVCGTPYKKITNKYIYGGHDRISNKKRTLFLSKSEFECDVCRYVHDELDYGYCDYAEKK